MGRVRGSKSGVLNGLSRIAKKGRRGPLDRTSFRVAKLLVKREKKRLRPLSSAGVPVSIGNESNSVLGNFGIDLVAPGQDAALHVEDVGEAGFLEGFLGLRGTHTALAVDYDLIGLV